MENNKIAVSNNFDAFQEIENISSQIDIPPAIFISQNFQNDKIRLIKNNPEFEDLITAAIIKIVALAAIKSELSTFDISDIKKMLKTAYSDLTVHEIFKAFELERYGSYPEKTNHYDLFNADYVATVLKKYKVWKQQIREQHNINPQLEQKTEMTDKEKKDLVNMGLIRVFNEYVTTKELPAASGYIFDELFARDIIRKPVTPNEQMYYLRKNDEAKAIVKEQLHQEKTITDGLSVKRINQELLKIEQGNLDIIAGTAKKLIVKDYFDKVIKTGVDYEDIILST